MPNGNDPPTTDDLRSVILQGAIDGIESVTDDGLTVRAMSTPDQLAVLDQITARTASKNSRLGIVCRVLIPPGAG